MARPRLNWMLQGESRSAVVRSKVEWANHHRGLLHEALETFRGRNPYLITEDRQSRELKDYRVVTAHPLPAPGDLTFILADFVQNLRVALDYLVGEMRPDGPSRNSGFPICLQRPQGRHGFRNRHCVNLRGIPDEAVKLIHWMQPYQRTHRDRGTFREALRAVEVLRNVSEHRTLLVVIPQPEPHYVGRERSGDEGEQIGFRFPGSSNNSAAIWLPVTDPEEEFDRHFRVRISLAKPRGFADDWLSMFERWDLAQLVDYLHRAIRYEVLPQFNPFLKNS